MQLSNFSLANKAQVDAWFRTPRAFLLKLDKPSPYAAYCFLKDHFGEGNLDAVDVAKSQWAYVLVFDKGFVFVYDWKLWTWSIAVHLDDENEEIGRSVARAVLREVMHHSQKHRSAIRVTSKDASTHIIQNPYTLYHEPAIQLMNLATSDTLGYGGTWTTGTPLQDWGKPALRRAAFLLLLASFEGFLNLVYELYLRAALRDERIYERLAREQIDMKVRLAPVYCTCFGDEPFDHTSAVFKDFQTLINLRNDFVHANLTKTMRFPVVFEDDLAFVLLHDDKPLDVGLPRSFGELEQEHLEKAKRIVESTIEWILGYMKPRCRRDFDSAMAKESIIVQVKGGERLVR